METKEAVFPKGIFFAKPRDGAPNFIRGSVSIKVADAIPFLEANKNASGYVNLDIKQSREGKYYMQLNTFVPKKKESFTANANTEVEDMPF